MEQLEIWSIVQESEPNSNLVNSKIVQLHEFRSKPNLKLVARLRKLGDSMNKRIKLCKQERSTHTAKKAREAEEFYLEGVRLEVVQTWLYQMAQAIEANCLPSVLTRITNKVPLETLRKYCKEKWYPGKIERWEKTTDKELNEIFSDPLVRDERDRLIKAGIHSATQVKAAISALFDLERLLEQKGVKPQVRSQKVVKRETELQRL